MNYPTKYPHKDKIYKIQLTLHKITSTLYRDLEARLYDPIESGAIPRSDRNYSFKNKITALKQ